MKQSCLLFRKLSKLKQSLKVNAGFTLSHGSLLFLVALFITFDSQQGFAQTGAKHLGVASCSASTCHGSNVRFADSNILRNEFRVWNESDPHARAFLTLLSDDSKRIAKNLGVESAEESALCLGCHADSVLPEQQGEQFRVSDGVGCEVCHGAAEDYLDLHTNGDHQQNLKNGLYPSEDPHARAQLCVSCHVGNDSNRKITHEIMGAGHPRLSFELNTFSSIQPAHYLVDQDYVERKGAITELQIWAMGQVVAAERFLENVVSFPKSGLFPELVHMDCLGCHQEMSKITWTQNPLTKLPAGSLRYNDAYLMMSYQIASAVMPESASSLLADINEFLSLPSDARLLEATTKLKGRLAEIRLSLTENPIKNKQGLSILSELIDVGLASSHRDYAAAEQSAMAINSVLKVLDAENELTDTKREVVVGVNELFESLNDANRYRADEFVRGLKKVRSLLDH
ncbi:multiheme c-type cytochrome [Arenicella sp. 4NH20-0111]|uniref:multiheme c-type cytochrome n=1 Tax=Arenicella sp. 4NH20-0111 TaxID=3127648 RepID=UPI00333FA9EC